MSKASTPFYPAPSTWQTSGPNLWSDVSRLPTVGTEFSACHRCGHKDAKPQGKEVPAPALARALGAGGCASGMGAGRGSVRGATTADARHLSHPLPSLCLTSSPSVVALAPASAGKLLWAEGPLREGLTIKHHELLEKQSPSFHPQLLPPGHTC